MFKAPAVPARLDAEPTLLATPSENKKPLPNTKIDIGMIICSGLTIPLNVARYIASPPKQKATAPICKALSTEIVLISPFSR